MCVYMDLTFGTGCIHFVFEIFIHLNAGNAGNAGLNLVNNLQRFCIEYQYKSELENSKE